MPAPDANRPAGGHRIGSAFPYSSQHLFSAGKPLSNIFFLVFLKRAKGASVDPAPIELLRYETPQTPPAEITYQSFSDGGVTITIPFRRKTKGGGLSGLLIGMLLVTYLLASPALFLAIKHHQWSILAFFTIMPTLLPALILLAIRFVPRTPDFVEVIAVSPDTVYIKLTNSKAHSFPRSDFKRLEICDPWNSTHGTYPRHIAIWFREHAMKKACIDRTIEETQAVAKAIQTAIDATRPRKSASGPPA
jgi:hypothetical protein